MEHALCIRNIHYSIVILQRCCNLCKKSAQQKQILFFLLQTCVRQVHIKDIHDDYSVLSAGRARDHPVMEIVPNKALSLSLSLSLSLITRIIDQITYITCNLNQIPNYIYHNYLLHIIEQG